MVRAAAEGGVSLELAMASGALIAALIGGGGALALVIYKRRTATPPPGSGDPCAALKGINDTAYQACQVANGLSHILDGIQGLNDVSSQMRGEVKRRDDINRSLNGAIAVPMAPRIGGDPHTFTLTGSALKYGNGCVPFEGSPGWSSCAPGSLDMTRWVFDDRHLLDTTEPAVATNEERQAAWDRDADKQQEYKHQAPIYVDAIMTGSISPDRPDPATLGPFYADGEDSGMANSPVASGNAAFGGFGAPAMPVPHGSLGWYVEGVPCVCPVGQAPAGIVAQGGVMTDHRGDAIPKTTCVPLGGGGGYPVPPPAVDGGTDESGHGVGAGGGGGGVDTGTGTVHVRTTYDGPTGTPPPGYHWVPATPALSGHWERDHA